MRIQPLCAGLALLGLLGSGCMTLTPVVNSADLSHVDFTQPLKRGEACETWVLGVGPFAGTASVVQAAKSAALASVKVVDYERRWYVVASQSCVVVYGVEAWSGS
jgi:hypothetical protein